MTPTDRYLLHALAHPELIRGRRVSTATLRCVVALAALTIGPAGERMPVPLDRVLQLIGVEFTIGSAREALAGLARKGLVGCYGGTGCWYAVADPAEWSGGLPAVSQTVEEAIAGVDEDRDPTLLGWLEMLGTGQPLIARGGIRAVEYLRAIGDLARRGYGGAHFEAAARALRRIGAYERSSWTAKRLISEFPSLVLLGRSTKLVRAS